MLRSIKTVGMLSLGALMLCAAMPKTNADPVTLPTRSSLLPTNGTREIGFAGNFVFNGNNAYNANATYGYFTSPTLELGVEAGVAGAKHASTFSNVGVFGDYYFGGSTEGGSALLPYVGLFAGYAHQNESTSSYGAQVGAKYFFNPNVAFTGEVQYRSVQHGGNNTELVLGLSTFFH